ncbi:MAG: cob(I)yrinic acid a,c-diamide adenosyltransferase [Bacteroidaceae bacterium]|nr:cob(I)yrinic acid a,c-diamide adenosyltransferase [Bacteroidaceae bacterium]
MKKSNVYTRRGDTGMTGLASGQRVPKSHCRLEAYGTLDELNSLLGLLCTYQEEKGDRQRILQIQNDLFSVSCELATLDCQPKNSLPVDAVTMLEHAIDETECGEWRGFILPGGTRGAALAHVCRTVCRRVERCIYRIDDGSQVNPILLQYINRLSDYLFVLAKKMNKLAGQEEIIWKSH